jgi:methylated-DNA-[protein]-cysteine S-methyltransferase
MRISTKPAEPLQTVTYATPQGDGWVTFRGEQPWELGLPGEAAGRDAVPAARLSPAAARWVDLLERYFGGERVIFPLDVAAFAVAHGCTSFEADVLAALAAVPYGSTVSYRELAELAGRPAAQRATGSVMARNPLPVILPCHRVVRSDGTLGNYGDDPRWKVRLLTLEGALPAGGRQRARSASARVVGAAPRPAGSATASSAGRSPEAAAPARGGA